MISTDSRIILHCFLTATRFYQVGDHLICIRAVIICATLRDQIVIKSRGRYLEFLRFLTWLWTMHTRGRLKGTPPLRFHNFRHCPSWSHDHCEGREAVIAFAGCFFEDGGTTWASSSLVLSSAVWESRNTASPGRLLISESLPDGAGVNQSDGSLVSDSDSLLSPTGGCNCVTGRRSLMWRGAPSTRTNCGLITSVITSVSCRALASRFLTQTTSPSLILSPVTFRSGSGLVSMPITLTWYLCNASVGAVEGETSSFGVTLYQ